MMIRNNLRKLARETSAFLALWIAIIGGTLLYNANKQAEGFITIAHKWPALFASGNILIKRVHEEHWNIVYEFEDCPDSRKTEENHRLLRESLAKGIRVWLAPLREITDRPIVDTFVFYKPNEWREWKAENGPVDYDIWAEFFCETGRSLGGSGQIYMKETNYESTSTWIAPTLPYFTGAFLHELGHAFDLADTYIGNPSFSPASTGGSANTIGRQPYSLMSVGACRDGETLWTLCLDDKRAIQWLYRYHWEGLDPTNCPPEFEYEELTHEGKTVGGCVLKQPLIVELRQGHLHKAEQILGSDKNLKINDQDEHGLTALHYIARLYPEFHWADIRGGILNEFLKHPDVDINVTNKWRNTPLHTAAWVGNGGMVSDLLFINIERVRDWGIMLNAQNNYGLTALHYAAKSGRNDCAMLLLKRTDIKPNIKDNRGNTPLHEAAKNGRTEVVTMLLAHQDINPNLRNAAGFTPLQLAMQGGAVSDADSDASFQADYPEFWLSLSEENRQHLSSRLSPAALQQAHAEIAALLRAHPGIILPDASDVNGDGVVNILDLVQVSNAFGQRGQVPEDVNGDGVVNVQDLVWVSGAFGQ